MIHQRCMEIEHDSSDHGSTCDITHATVTKPFLRSARTVEACVLVR